VLGAVFDGAELGTHAEFGDHGAGDLGGLLDVGHCPGGRLAKHKFFGGTPTHREHQLRDHF